MYTIIAHLKDTERTDYYYLITVLDKHVSREYLIQKIDMAVKNGDIVNTKELIEYIAHLIGKDNFTFMSAGNIIEYTFKERGGTHGKGIPGKVRDDSIYYR